MFAWMWANFSHKGHCNGPSHNRQDKNRVELGPRFPTSLCRPGKKHQHKEAAVQHKMPVPPKQIWFYLSWLFICITAVTSESQLDTKPHVFPISECLQIKGLLLVNYVRDEKIFVQRSGEVLSLTYSPLIFGIMWTKCCVLLPCQVHSWSFEGK